VITTTYDKLADRFEATRTRLRSKEETYLGLLLKSLSVGSSVLDLGCGTGNPIATYIASRGHNIVGVDGSAAMLAIARNRLPEHRWIHDLIERVEFDETFDAVVCWDSLFHLPRDQHQSVIRKIHSWLVPGGRLMVSSGGLVDEKGSGFTENMFGEEFFYDSLPPDQMVMMVRLAGFDIVLAEGCDQLLAAMTRGSGRRLHLGMDVMKVAHHFSGGLVSFGVQRPGRDDRSRFAKRRAESPPFSSIVANGTDSLLKS
jgi:cyclopropane fatty-acyl-phospholipid synthase-like methyltransferase